jgi:hypothetical protein|tara:strand:+ start:7847 stop:8161 length:315 start_codon:yes stop_codon:yes gene_type:complete
MNTQQSKSNNENNQIDTSIASGGKLPQKQIIKDMPEYEVYCRDGSGNYEPFNDYDLALNRMYELNKKTGFYCGVLDKKCAVISSVEGRDFVLTVTPIKLTSGEL